MAGKRNGSTTAWRKLRAQVIAEEPLCQLQIAGTCTRISTTADHIVPVSQRPDLELVRANCRGSCAPCNYKRGARPLSAMPSQRALNFFA